MAVDLEWAWPIAGEEGKYRERKNIPRKGKTHCRKGRLDKEGKERKFKTRKGKGK